MASNATKGGLGILATLLFIWIILVLMAVTCCNADCGSSSVSEGWKNCSDGDCGSSESGGSATDSWGDCGSSGNC